MDNVPDANCVSPVLIPTAFIWSRMSSGLLIVGMGKSLTSYSAGRHFFGATRVRVVDDSFDMLYGVSC
jgi:hypothetical protein